MSLNCNSCDGKSNALPNAPSNSTSNQSTIIPITIDPKFEIAVSTEITNPISNTIVNLNDQAIINYRTDYEHCTRVSKERIYQLIKNEELRIEFRRVKYGGWSKFVREFNENFFDILVDGLLLTNLVVCRCTRFIKRKLPHELNMKNHLRTQYHSNAYPNSLFARESAACLAILNTHRNKNWNMEPHRAVDS